MSIKDIIRKLCAWLTGKKEAPAPKKKSHHSQRPPAKQAVKNVRICDLPVAREGTEIPKPFQKMTASELIEVGIKRYGRVIDLAKETGIPRTNLSAWKNGRWKPRSVEALLPIIDNLKPYFMEQGTLLEGQKDAAADIPELKDLDIRLLQWAVRTERSFTLSECFNVLKYRFYMDTKDDFRQRLSRLEQNGYIRKVPRNLIGRPSSQRYIITDMEKAIAKALTYQELPEATVTHSGGGTTYIYRMPAAQEKAL